MAKKLGVKPELCFGMCCYSCVHGAEQVPDFCPHAKTLQDGKVHVAKVFEEALGGDLIVTTTPLKDENGKILGTIHIARPVNKAE
jgi:hypothetical protein